MSKYIPNDGDIYIAPKLLGKKRNGKYIVLDQSDDDRVLDPNNVDDKITIYEKEVQGWLLDVASKLLDPVGKNIDNCVAIIMICMSYFEGVEQYRSGKSSSGGSKNSFIKSVKRVYPDPSLTEKLADLYSDARCGLFHDGMVRNGVIFSYSFEEGIKLSEDRNGFEINPKKLLQDIKEDFRRYIRQLRDDRELTLRRNFEKMFQIIPEQSD